MKRLLSLLLALLALCDLARGQAVNTLSVSNNVADTNYMLFVVGNRLVRVSKTNVFDAIKPATLLVNDLTATGTVTAASFSGASAGSPGLLDLRATNSTGRIVFTVAGNLASFTTNVFDLLNPSAGQVLSVHSSSAGVTVWTNATASGGSGGTVGPVLEDHFLGGSTTSGTVGDLGWTYTAVGTSYTASQQHPGVFQFSGNVSGTVYYTYLGAGDAAASANIAEYGWTNKWVVKIDNATSLTNSTIRFGWGNAVTANPPTHFIGLEITNGATSGTWFGTCISNSTISSVSSSLGASVNFVTNEVRCTASSNVTFVVNGTALTSIPFMPTTGMRPFAQIIPTESSSKVFDLDYFKWAPSFNY